MCFVPMVEVVLKSPQDCKTVLPPVLLVLFGWGLTSQLAGLHYVVPSMAGLAPKSGFTLLGVYVIGRLYRLHEGRFDALPLSVYVLAFLVLGGLCTLGLGWLGTYNSPFAVLFALSAFHLFKRRVVLPRVVGRMVVWLSPSVFAVYVLHANECAYKVLAQLVDLLRTAMPTWASLVLTAALAFAVCLVIDLLRRFVFSSLRQFQDAFALFPERRSDYGIMSKNVERKEAKYRSSEKRT